MPDRTPMRQRTAARVGAHRAPRMILVTLVAGSAVLGALVPCGARAGRLPSDAVGGQEAGRGSLSGPDVGMRAGTLVTMDGRELWSREATEPRAMASTTKIMTAVVVLEHARPNDVVQVSRQAVRIGESEAGLSAGQRTTVRRLLEAMLVTSGNDAAIALAEHVGGSAAGFVRLMDSKARSLGLSATDFENPHGLDAAGHHTSAADLAVLTRCAMRLPEFRRIVRMRSVSIPTPQGARLVENSNELLRTYRGTEGVKTGWTDDAGYCLVAVARRGETELFAVVLGTLDEHARFRDAARLLDWGFEHYGFREVVSRDATVGAVAVTDWLDKSVPAVVQEGTSCAVFDGDGDVERRTELVSSVRAPVKVGDPLGTLTITQGRRLLARVRVVSGTSVAKPSFWQRVRMGFVRLWRFVADVAPG